MEAHELLQKYPLAAKVVKEWFLDKMLESMKNSSEIPEDFKQSLLEQGVTDKSLELVIDSQPRTLFDVFDENNLIIEIVLNTEDIFTCRIKKLLTNKSWKTRKEAEYFAIEAAFSLLEEKLKPIDLPNLKE